MRKRLMALSLALATVVSSGAKAADGNHLFAVRGAGALSCRVLNDAKPAQLVALRRAVDVFSMGYVSALNRLTPDTYDLLPLTEPGLMAAWVQAVCKVQPKQQIESVVFGIVQRVSALKVARKSPSVVARDAHGTVVVEQATLVSVQKALIRQGVLKGTADGKFSKDTSEALTTYQRKMSLAQTGLPDGPTVVRLLVADAHGGSGGGKKPWWKFW